MSDHPCLDPAFVGSTPPTFPNTFNPSLGRSFARARPPARCKNRFVRNWRCMITGEGLGDAVNQKEVPGDVGGQVEGPVEGQISDLELSALDGGLQDALSKSWDVLEGFEAGMELPVVEVNEEEHVEEGDGEEEEGKKDKEVVNEQGSVLEVVHESAGEDSEESVNVREKGEKSEQAIVKGVEAVVGDEDDASVQVLESDAAVEAIEEAKGGKKKKKKGASTATKKKTKATAKKRGKKTVSEDSEEDERELTKREILDSETWDPKPRWYFLQVKPGCEQSCAISIRNMTKSLANLEVHEVLVPATTILRLTKGGQSKKKEERIFPGYILVRMVMNYQNYNDLRRVPNVQYFMGDPNRDKSPNEPFRSPIPVSDAEMKVVYEKVSAADNEDPEEQTQLRPGDSVEVLWGNFQGNKGRVHEVKPHSNIVTVRLLMFGRETPVELGMDQVKAIPDIMNIPESEGELETEDGGTDDRNKRGKNKRNMESRRKENTRSYTKDGPNADVASAADDLAALLADVPGASDDDFDDFFNDEEQGDEFGLQGEFTGVKRGAESKKNKIPNDPFAFLDFDEETAADGDRPKSWSNEESEVEQLKEGSRGRAQSPVSDGSERNPFAFLDEDINEATQVSTQSELDELSHGDDFVERANQAENSEKRQSSTDALIKSGDDLASFLSNEEGESICDTPDDMSTLPQPEGAIPGSRSSGDKDGDWSEDEEGQEDSDLFAFLDEFDEAEVVPDDTEISTNSESEKESNSEV